MNKAKKVIPIADANDDRYSWSRLLRDGSVNLPEGEAEKLLSEFTDAPINTLLHPEVRYEVTDKCNATCIMCPRDKHEHGREHGIMNQQAYERSLDEVVELGAKKIVLTGFGEPTLDKKLEQKIAYAKSKGLLTYIITNGSTLSTKRARSLIESGLDEMRVSFYGMRRETYNAVMQGLDFDRALEGLLGFLELRKQLGSPIRVQISYLEMEENKADTEYFQEFWEPKVDALEIWRPHNWSDGREYRDTNVAEELRNTCGRPENGPLQIQWNGEVIPCCYDYNNAIVLGNAFQQPVLEIMNGPKYRLLRLAHRAKKFAIFPFCNQCDQLVPHADALMYTNRHNLPPEEAVKLSNTDLYNLAAGQQLGQDQLSSRYRGKP
ncbi:MAG: radical SAM protein [Deltaproteobacteria bacterium]|nr:radical SAM protein [Deltaproteobacteria bacterium]